MKEIIFKCGKCNAPIKADPADAGQEGECPTCGTKAVVPGGKQEMPVPPPLLPTPPTPPPLKTPRPREADGVVTAGWICWGVGMLLLCILMIIPFYMFFFIASLVLAIVAITRKRTRAGVALILSTVFVPPIVAACIVATVAGGIMNVLTGANLVPQGEYTATVVPAAEEVTQPAQNISIGGFLSALDAAARVVRAAETTAQKDDARRKAHAWARAALANKKMTIKATVNDVRIPRDGAAEIRFNNPSVDVYENIKDHSLSLSFPGAITLRMTRADALKIGKLHTLVMSGTPEFRPGSGNVLGDVMSGSGGLMHVTVRGEMNRLGTLWLQNAQYKVVR